MCFCGPLHIDEQRQDDQLEPTYSCTVQIPDVAWGPTGSNGRPGVVVREGRGYPCWWCDMMMMMTVAIIQNNRKILISYVSNGKNTVQAKQWLDKCYSDSAQSETMIKRWYAYIKRGCTDTNDAERSGHPNSTVVPENTKKNPQNRFGPS